jgi:dethiobiotin synthetase
MHRYFVTGTDTEVGKTFVSCALLHLARERFESCVGLKPIAAGCEPVDGTWQNEDALALIDAAATKLPYAEINPVALEPAIAPHIALAEADRRIDVRTLADHCLRIAADHQFVLVEGAGGWLVPLNDDETLADLCSLLGFDVILVVGMKLGCINHACLTAEVVRASGLKLAGWVANSVTGPMPYLDENLATLEQRLAAPCLGKIPHIEAGPGSATRYLSLDPLTHVGSD